MQRRPQNNNRRIVRPPQPRFVRQPPVRKMPANHRRSGGGR